MPSAARDRDGGPPPRESWTRHQRQAPKPRCPNVRRHAPEHPPRHDTNHTPHPESSACPQPSRAPPSNESPRRLCRLHPRHAMTDASGRTPRKTPEARSHHQRTHGHHGTRQAPENETGDSSQAVQQTRHRLGNRLARGVNHAHIIHEQQALNTIKQPARLKDHLITRLKHPTTGQTGPANTFIRHPEIERDIRHQQLQTRDIAYRRHALRHMVRLRRIHPTITDHRVFQQQAANPIRRVLDAGQVEQVLRDHIAAARHIRRSTIIPTNRRLDGKTTTPASTQCARKLPDNRGLPHAIKTLNHDEQVPQPHTSRNAVTRPDTARRR